nr:hypothetical protein [uncultured Vibrio sp.]
MLYLKNNFSLLKIGLLSELFEIFGEKAPSLLSGVFGKNDNAGMNSALLAFIDEGGQTFDILRQEKHHRWFLDRNQLRNYNLSLALDPGKKWWENISFKDLLFEIFGEKAPSLLSGVFGKNDNAGMNSALLAFIDEGGQTFDILRQEKHHRWFLDRNQLRNYNLSLALDPGKKWWENISIGRRHLTTLKTTDGVRLCPLICEDLARQEPVAQAVRSVGPNLVISLLLDGPQISPRWPGKYAAVLSDDPGSSVLSVTALGMTKRATGLGHDPSSEVALWSEPNKGSETLKVSSSQGGLVIELELEPTKMWSIDGKSQIKPILRKKMHTTVELEYGDRSVPALKQSLIKALKARR